MKSFNLIAALIFTIPAFAEEGRLGREANEYRYTSLGIDVIQTEKTGIGASFNDCWQNFGICSF